MPKLIAIAGAIAVAIFAFGCGGDSGDEALTHVSKAQFIEQARTICTKAQKEIRAVLLGEEEPGSANGDRYKQLAPLLKREADELRSISGPEEVEVRMGPLIEKISEASELVAQEGEGALTDQRIAAYKSEAFDLHLRDC